MFNLKVFVWLILGLCLWLLPASSLAYRLDNLLVTDITPVAAVVVFSLDQITEPNVLVKGVFAHSGQYEEINFASQTSGLGVYVNRVQIKGLLPLTHYNYEVRVKEAVLAKGEFTTAKPLSWVPLPSTVAFCFVKNFDLNKARSALVVFWARDPAGISVPLSIITQDLGVAYFQAANFRYDSEDKDFLITPSEEIYCLATDGKFEARTKLRVGWRQSPYRMADVVLGPRYGDLDADGFINDNDLSMLLASLVGKIKLTPDQFRLADVSGSGKVSAFDASLILRYLAGGLSSFPVVGNNN